MEQGFYRSKLLNAILYFCLNTRHLNLTKLLKLLYFLDFTHCKETGTPSIGLEYFAWKRGPVPKDFYEEIKGGNVPGDFEGSVAIIPQDWTDLYADRQEYIGRVEYSIKALVKPDTSVFTPRELKILASLCDMYRDATATQMSEITHLAKQPWSTTLSVKGALKSIDYLLAIDDKSPVKPEEARERLREHFEMVRNFGLVPLKKD